MMFSVFMVIAAMVGGWWLIDLSFKSNDVNHDGAAVAYWVAGVIWCAACLGMAGATYVCK